MGTDISRMRSDPLLDFSGVDLKQGGVVLDADFNELGAIVDRRLRALASDVLGRATVSATTPDAFRITVAGGDLVIGKGRMLVDGLPVEHHGLPSADPAKQVFDPLLGELAFADPCTYATQPYLPEPPALPASGRYLVYLDAWDREVTHLERPELVEVAVGVESASRHQVVWQVRVADQPAGDATCGGPDAQWDALTAPSTGRLTTGTYAASAADDPCELPPTGGYRGLENQTYRVEIHDPGQPGGTATFTWSRENASVGSRVTSVVSATELELASLGRDEVLRFTTGDWVEILDDAREFAQRGGEVRQVTVNEAAQRITFTPALAGLGTSGLRVRRWDQRGQVLATGTGGATTLWHDLDAAPGGVIPVPPAGTTLLLEDGVTVAFASVGTTGFKAGDHWVFAARTADASVEALTDAPPRGVHHHYARLGYWDVGSGAVSDCRQPWPPATTGQDCCCAVCVTAASHADGSLTIQAAIDRLGKGGGTVCLAAGHYALERPLLISDMQGLTIRGQGPATVLTSAGGALRIARSRAIAVEDLAILGIGRTPAPLIGVATALGLTLQRLALSARLPGTAAIALAGVVGGATISGNEIRCPIGVRGVDAKLDGSKLTALTCAQLRIEDNLLDCAEAGVDLAGRVLFAEEARIAGNHVIGGAAGAITVLGASAPGCALRVCGNHISAAGPGITAGIDGLWIEGNKLVAAPPGEDAPGGAGVALRAGSVPARVGLGQVLANQISGFAGAGIAIALPVRELIIKLNIVNACGNGITGSDDAASEQVSIDNNHLADIGGGRGGGGAELVGIGLLRAAAGAVSGNAIRRVGLESKGAPLCAGIATVAAPRLRVVGNDVAGIGAPGAAAPGAGILVRGTLSQVEVSANLVDREAQPTASGAGGLAALRIGSARAGRDGLFATVRIDALTVLTLGGRRPFLTALPAPAAATAVAPAASANVHGNAFATRGGLPAVQLAVAGDCQFHGNRCELRGGQGGAAVELAGVTTIVHANRVQGGKPSIAISGDAKRTVVLGNATSSEITVGDQALDPKWRTLNVVLP